MAYLILAPGRQTPPSCPSTPGSTYKNVVNPAQARAPMFITVRGKILIIIVK